MKVAPHLESSRLLESADSHRLEAGRADQLLDFPAGAVVVGIKTADVDAAAEAIEAHGGAIVKGPYNDAHERRAVVYDHKGNGLVFYSPLPQ